MAILCYYNNMNIEIIEKKISHILTEYGVTYAGVFGSVARGEDKPESDIDILIRMGKPLGMFSYMALIRNIETSLGRKVAVVTEKSLNKFVRPYVIPELKTVYEKR